MVLDRHYQICEIVQLRTDLNSYRCVIIRFTFFQIDGFIMLQFHRFADLHFLQICKLTNLQFHRLSDS